MAEHPHRHDDEHDAGSCCDHSHAHASDPLSDLDQANQSLADALRVSFRLLTLIMILLVVAFLMTGLKTVAPNQVAIKKVFGRKTAEVLKAGLIYNWPYPVGEIELIDTSNQLLEINDFWMYESESDKLTELSKRNPVGTGLRPGWDGALLTGDRSLFHVRFDCTYAVRQGALARASVGDIRQAVHTAVCDAAIRTAAVWSADDINRNSSGFALAVRNQAQEDLNALMGLDKTTSAVEIMDFSLGAKSWPLHVLGAINNVTAARANQEKSVQSARADALNTLNSLMDRKYVDLLVGDVLNRSTATSRPGDEALPLALRYDAALKEGKAELASRLLEDIDAVLTRPDVGGEVSTIIQRSSSQASEVVQKVNARAERFHRLLADYKADPEFMIRRLWAQTREQILANPSAEKIYLTMGHERMVVYLSRDPRIIREINESMSKKKSDRSEH
ncbi:MAG: FtsH protease regulator HflK [Planctomycetes bacterium ADurb.Bin126]|nr:MAG: FtsH protease regulator HflK [Planctomycetes bacterium ADurb.Bin126]HOD83679.1 SPFH domain-containing protein [Phycisphaerae bacterium]HQL75164.1 SPFH domain-containing protein [Phycisphaerae bacterium]